PRRGAEPLVHLARTVLHRECRRTATGRAAREGLCQRRNHSRRRGPLLGRVPRPAASRREARRRGRGLARTRLAPRLLTVTHPSRPFVVGLTGGIGSGKSAAAERFAELGIEVVDTDAIAHALTAPGGEAIEAIRAAFGE